jgi:transposase-like protein
MSLTPTPLYCPECGCHQIEAHKSYTVKAGGVRRLYYCPDCKGYFSETHNTPLANLKTPLSCIAVCASLHMVCRDLTSAQRRAGGQCGLPGVWGEQKQPLSLARTLE